MPGFAEMLAALVATFVMVTVVIVSSPTLATRLGLVAQPGAHRRHAGAVPLTGGVALSAGLGLGLWLAGAYPGTGMLGGWSLLLLTGVVDDRFSLPYWTRFVVQIAAMLCLVWIDGVYLADLGAVFSTEVAGLGGWSTALTVFAGVGVINAVNMVDGMDGLAGSLVMVCVVGIIIALGGDDGAARLFAILLIAALAGFLLFNLRLPFSRWSRRVFLGDAGSTTLGYFLAWLLIANSQGDTNAFPPVLALWLLALPLFDAVGVLLRRPLNGLSPFHADWRHTHHLLQRAGLSVNRALTMIVVLATGFALVGLLALSAGVAQHIMFYLFLGTFAGYLMLTEWADRRLPAPDSVGQ